MTLYRLRSLVFALTWLLLLPVTALAQTPESGSSITIEGQIVNGTPGATVPPGLPLMLHTYDGRAMSGMTNGVADAEGRFRFEDVAMAPGRSFEVMVVYHDITYFSERIEPQPGQTQLRLPVTIYETTTDAAAVSVEQLHLLLDFTPGTMQVMQLFILSNAGDRTVVARGEQEGLRFRLPSGATEISFENDRDGTRFVRLEGGFMDTAPVVPGQGTLPVLVSYALPYSGQLDLEVPVDYPTTKASILLPDMGITLSGSGWNVGQELLLRGRVHQVYNYGHLPLAPGDTLRVTLAGQPELATSAPSDSAAARITVLDDRRLVFTIGVVVSLALIGSGGVWWWLDRRRRAIPVSTVHEPQPETLETVLQAIAALDEAYEAGTIDEAEYQKRRAHLRDQAVTLMMDERT